MSRKSYSVRRLQRHGYVFVGPTVILFAVFLIYPMLSAFRLSFFNWNLLEPQRFVGFGNFERMITDGRVINSFFRTLQFTVISVVVITLVSFSFSIFFSTKLLRLRNVHQSMVFLPVVLSIVPVGVVWTFMYQSTGILNVFLQWSVKMSVPWLTNTRVAPYSIIVVYVWKSVGYYMVIYIAGLLNVEENLYEAARIDGAGFWGQLIFITIPSLKNTFALAVVSCMLFTFGQFPLQYTMTEGGPSQSTEILALLIFTEGFKFNRFGYASTISVLYFVTLLILSIIQLRLLRSDSTSRL